MLIKYESPEIEIYRFNSSDVIATSDETEPLDPNNDGND